jgi:hypothetical protein
MDLEQLAKSELIKIARQYAVYYRTKTGQGSMSGYDRLSKTELIYAIRSDPDYKKERKTKTRIELLKEKLQGRQNNPDFIMSSILELFGDGENVPRPGYYCTYVYNAKTPGLLYDQHPLIAVLDIREWGFTGINFHLNLQRNYTWPEVGSQFCTIENSEIGYFRSLPYRVLLRNS